MIIRLCSPIYSYLPPQNILEVSSDSPPLMMKCSGGGGDAMDANLLDEYNILTDQGGLQLVLFTDTFKFL